MDRLNSMLQILVDKSYLVHEDLQDSARARAKLAASDQVAIADVIQRTTNLRADSAQLLLFLRWVKTSSPQLGKSLAARLNAPYGLIDTNPVTARDFPEGTPFGMDAEGSTDSHQGLKVNFVDTMVSPKGIRLLFNTSLLFHVEARLVDLLSDEKQSTIYSTSKNAREAYLNLVGFLLPKNQPEFEVMSNMDIEILAEALARADIYEGQEISPRLEKTSENAVKFLARIGLHPMSQMALAIRDGRILAGGFYAGQGAPWTEEIQNLLYADDVVNRNVAANLYPQLAGPLRDEDGIDLDRFATSDNFYDVNGVPTTSPSIPVAQALQTRVLNTYGLDVARFHVLGGQSQGEAVAFAAARAFDPASGRVDYPTYAQVGGFGSVKNWADFIRYMASQGRFFVPAGPNVDGAEYAIATSGIPNDDTNPSENLLGQMLQAINEHFGLDQLVTGEHIFASNVNVDVAPYYYTLVGGTPRALRLLSDIINCYFAKAKPARFATPHKEDLLAVWPKVEGILKKLNRTYVQKPLSGREMGIALAPHDPYLLTQGHPDFLTEIASRGITLGAPSTTIVTNPKGETAQDRHAAGEAWAAIPSGDNFFRTVWVGRTARAMQARGAHVLVDLGSGKGSTSFIIKNGVTIPVITVATEEGMEAMTTRSPAALRRALAASQADDVFLPDGMHVVSMGEARVAADVSLPSIPGVELTKTVLADGSIQYRAKVIGALTEESGAKLKEFFAQSGEGRLAYFFTQDKIGEEANPYTTFLTQPFVGETLEWVVKKESEGDRQISSSLKIYEADKPTLEVTRTGVNAIVTREFVHTSHGVSMTERAYFVDVTSEEPLVYGDIRAIHAGSYPHSARAAYLKDWGTGIIPNAAELLNAPSSSDLLQTFSLKYTKKITLEDMLDYAKNRVGSTDERFVERRRSGGIEAHPSYAKDAIEQEGVLLCALLEAADLDPALIRNLGGSEHQYLPIKAGDDITVEFFIRSVNDTSLGRIMEVFARGTNQRGETVFENNSVLGSLIDTGLTGDEVRPVLAARTDLPPTDADFLAGKKVYTPEKQNLVTIGTVATPDGTVTTREKGNKRFKDDENRIHIQTTSARLAGLDDVIMRGEESFDLVNESILRDKRITGGDASRYVGFKNRQFQNPVAYGEKLSYNVTRIRHGEGVHEYEVEVVNASGDPVMTYTLYAKGPKTLVMWAGQGVIDKGAGDEAISDPIRAAHFYRLQSILMEAGFNIDMRQVLNEASDDTALVQPSQAGYVVPLYDRLVDQGLIPDDAIQTGLSLGMWYAMYAAGYVDEQTMMAGLGKRGADVGALLDDTVGMGVANSINLTDDEIDAVCREAWSADGTELVFPSNFNRYNQVIFGGHKKAIERLLKILEERKAVKSGSDVFMLDSVKTPFHTPLLREASERMRAFFKATPVFYPRRPNVSRVLMDTTGAYLPEDTGAIQEIFADQISNPTKLREVIRMAILAGVRRFVEIGIRENLAKHVFSVAKSLGFTDPEAEFEILFVNPEVNPEDYSRFTYDFVESPLPKAAPVPVVAEKPKEEAAAPVAMSMMMPQMGVAAPSWKEVTSAEFRQAYTQLGIRAIGHKVNKDDVTQAGDQALYKLVTQQAKKITVIGDAAFESLVEQFTADMVALEPGALGFLRDQNAYLAGVLGLEGGDLNKRSLWADWSEGDLIAYCKAMWEANAAVGEFTINPDNFVREAELSDKGKRPIGIGSKKITGALRMISGTLGICTTKKEGEALKTFGDFLDLMMKKLKEAPMALPEAPSEVRHMASVMYLAGKNAIAKLEVKEKEAKARAVPAFAGMPMAAASAPTWAEVTAPQLRSKLLTLGVAAIGHKVNKDNVAQAGDQPLFKLVTQQAKKVTVLGDESFGALAGQLTSSIQELGPGAVDVLGDSVAYYRGVLGLEGGDLNKRSLWADWSEGDLIAYCKAMWEANAAVGEFTINADNFVREAELSDKGKRPIGIGSKKITGALRMISGTLGICTTKKEGEALKTFGDFLDLVMKKLKEAPLALPEAPSEVRHMVSVMLTVQEQALTALKKEKSEALSRAQVPAMGGMMMGGGVDPAELDARDAALRAEFAASLQASGKDAIRAFVRSMGVAVDESTLQQVTISPAGRVTFLKDKDALEKARRLERLEASDPAYAKAIENANFRPELEYGFGNVEAVGAMENLFNFMRMLNTSTFPTDAYEQNVEINVLANQLDERGLAHARWLRDQTADAGKRSVLDRLIARTENSLKNGPSFDGVIHLNGAVHEPVYGTYSTRVVDRGMTTLELLDHYRKIGIPESTVKALETLIKQGRDLRGKDFVVSGAGTIGEPMVAMLLRLGARVIILDYKGRSAKQGMGYRSDHYRELLKRNGVRGIENQLVIEPNLTLGDEEDSQRLFDHMVARGYRPRGFFHTGAVSDYGDYADRGSPLNTFRVHVDFVNQLEKRWAKYYQANEEILRAEFTEKNKDRIVNVAPEALASRFRAKYAGQSVVPALPFKNAQNEIVYVPFTEAFSFYMASNRFPTPNDRHQFTGSGTYEIKEGAAPGATAQVAQNESVRYADGTPVLIEDHHRTGGTYPADGLQPSGNEDKNTRLMEKLALFQQGMEENAPDYDVNFYGFQGGEIAGMSIATMSELFDMGPLAFLRETEMNEDDLLGDEQILQQLPKGRVIVNALPEVVHEHDSTGGVRALEKVLAARGKTFEDLAGKIRDEELAMHTAMFRFALPPKTDAVHLPLDGSLYDPNNWASQYVVTDGRTEGRFAPKPTDIYPRPYTMMTLAAGMVGVGGNGPMQLARYWLARTGAELPEDQQWMLTPDLYDIARSMGEIGINIEALRGMSLEEIAAYFDENKLFDKMGAQRVEEALNYEFFVPTKAPEGGIEFEVKGKELAAQYERQGHKIFQEAGSKNFIVQVAEGKMVLIPARTSLAANVAVDLPGGSDHFNWRLFGVGVHRPEDTATRAFAQHMGKMSTGQSFMALGETPRSLHRDGDVSRDRHHGIKSLALADSNTLENTVSASLVRNENPTSDDMAGELGDGWVGQDGSEQVDMTGQPISTQSACSTGNTGKVIAGQLVRGAFHAVATGEAEPGSENQMWELGASDYARRAFILGAFIAAQALHTDERADELDLAIGQWSRANSTNVGGFVPGVAAGHEIQEPAQMTAGKNWNSGTIGGSYGTDGKDSGPREAYGIGLILVVFRAWKQGRTYIPGVTDREKLGNVRLLFQGHETSTPLGDPFENKVKKLFLKYAGVESFSALYDRENPLYLGVDKFEQLLDPAHPLYVSREGVHYLDALDQFLENNLPAEVRKSIGVSEGAVALDEASKPVQGHPLGAASAVDSVRRQVSFSTHLYLGNPNLDNARPELAQAPNLVQVNVSFNMDEVMPSDKPVLAISLAAGFSHKNTSVMEAEMKRQKESKEAVATDMAARLRQDARARTQMRAEREGKRYMVESIDAEPIPVTTYEDLRVLSTRSQSIARALAEGKTFDFDNILSWAINPEMFPLDPDVQPTKADVAYQKAWDRIKAMEANFKSEKIEATHQMAKSQNMAAQPYVNFGASDGMGLRTIMEYILAGAIKYGVVVHYDAPKLDNDRYMQAQALKAWANAHGVHLEVVNKSAIVFDSSSFVIEGEDFPADDQIDLGKLKYETFDEEILRAMNKVEKMAAEAAEGTDATALAKEWNTDIYIAFGAPERTPKAGEIKVPSIDAQGRLFFETVPDTSSWEEAVERTIGPMGFNVWAIIRQMADMGRLGTHSRMRQADWKNGADPRNAALQGVYYGLNALLKEVASLGIAKRVAKLALERLRNAFQEDGFYALSLKAKLTQVTSIAGDTSALAARKVLTSKEFKRADLEGKKKIMRQFVTGRFGHLQVAAYPFFFSFASRLIPGAWQWGLEQRQVLEERGAFLSMEDLAADANNKLLASHENLGADEMAAKMLEVDQHEYDAIEEVSRRAADLPAKMQAWMDAHPTEVLTDKDGKQYLPPEATRELLLGLVPDNYRDILAEYLPPVEKKAREMEAGASPLHKGLPTINAAFGAPRFESSQFVDGRMEYAFPDTYAGFSGITHGGMQAATMKAAIQAVFGEQPESRYVRQVNFEGHTPTGVSLTVSVNKGPNVTTAEIVDEEGHVVASTQFINTLRNERNGTLIVRYPSADGKTFDEHVIDKVSNVKPTDLFNDVEFECLPGCVAAGHVHEQGLQFKYAFDREHNAIWGVLDPTDGIDPIDAIVLAGDDMGCWAGMRAAKTWGFTTHNTFIPVSDFKAGERLFLVAEVPQADTPDHATVKVMNARGEVRAILEVGYFASEEATINGLVAGLKAEKQYGAQAVKTSLAFLKESMGDHFELYLAKARIQLARESAPKGTPSPAPAGEAKVASGAHTEDSADPRVPAPKPAGESGGEKLMAKVLEGGFARDVGDPIANAPDPTQGWLQISPQGEALKLATDRATKDKDDKPARRAPQTLKPSQRRPGVTALSRPWARMNAMRGPVLRPSIRANFLRPR